MPPSNQGGRRAGAGRPTQASIDAKKREAASAEAQAIAVAALPLAMRVLTDILADPEADTKDRMRAAQVLLEHGAGKPNVKATNSADAEITLVALVPRPGKGQEREPDGSEGEDEGDASQGDQGEE